MSACKSKSKHVFKLPVQLSEAKVAPTHSELPLYENGEVGPQRFLIYEKDKWESAALILQQTGRVKR